jgi:hypothetical protein
MAASGARGMRAFWSGDAPSWRREVPSQGVTTMFVEAVGQRRRTCPLDGDYCFGCVSRQALNGRAGISMSELLAVVVPWSLSPSTVKS